MTVIIVGIISSGDRRRLPSTTDPGASNIKFGTTSSEVMFTISYVYVAWVHVRTLILFRYLRTHRHHV